MLAAKRFPEILRSMLTDGIEGAMIMTVDGSVLSSDFLIDEGRADLTSPMSETAFAAIVSSIWYNYQQSSGIIRYFTFNIHSFSCKL